MNDNVDNSSQYVMLEPLNNIKSFGPTPDTFSLYLQTSFNVIMGVIIVMSVFRIIYGGMIFMTSDIVMNKLKGKEAIVGSLKGIFLAVVTWLLLYTINPDILNNKVGRIISDSVVTAGQGLGAVVGRVGEGGIGGKVDDGLTLFTRVINDEANARSKLSTGGIDINNPACANVGSRSCTDVGLINDNIISKIINLESDCKAYNSGCEVTITGGTEWWAHGGGVTDPNVNKSKHVPGKFANQAVDLALQSALLNFFKQKATTQGSDKYCREKYVYVGDVYCDENIAGNSPHFHVNY